MIDASSANKEGPAIGIVNGKPKFPKEMCRKDRLMVQLRLVNGQRR